MRRLGLPLSPVVAFAMAFVGVPESASASGPAPEPDDGEVFEEANDAEPESSELSPAHKKAQRKIVLGSVLGGFGFILSVAALGTLGVRATCEGQEKTDCARNNGIASLVLGVPGLALLATGSALLGIGLKRRRALQPSTALLTPMLVHRGGGAAFTLRF